MKPIKDIMTVDRVVEEVERYGEKELKYWKKYDFFETSDGLKVMLTPARATRLDTTIWKSDEDEHGNYITSDYYAPNEDARKALFIRENLDNLTEISDHAEHSNRTLYISKPTRTSDTLRTIVARHEWEINDWRDVERPMTAEEIEDLKEWEEEQRKAMTDRLERYWKRYKNKVRIDTYWVNR